MPAVPFNQETGMKCICGRCPVQAKSRCSKEKMEKIMKMMESDAPKGPLPKPAEVPFLYCAGGKAACTDLDAKQVCICGSCPVWSGYKLVNGKPSMYFCRDGKSK